MYYYSNAMFTDVNALKKMAELIQSFNSLFQSLITFFL